MLHVDGFMVGKLVLTPMYRSDIRRERTSGSGCRIFPIDMLIYRVFIHLTYLVSFFGPSTLLFLFNRLTDITFEGFATNDALQPRIVDFIGDDSKE